MSKTNCDKKKKNNLWVKMSVGKTGKNCSYKRMLVNNNYLESEK